MSVDIPQQLRNKFALPVADYRYCYQSVTGGKSGKNDVLRFMVFLILLAIPVITFICFENLFKRRRSNEWKPHDKLKENTNQFIHALFYILKDLRDIKDQESVSDWLNPELVKIYEIRNYIEHRSFKIIDSLYEDIVQFIENQLVLYSY